MKKFYVYKHTNLINGKIYIGKSNNPKNRWLRHIHDSKNNKIGSKQLLFHRAICKYGKNNFIMEILGEYDTDQIALSEEKKFIELFKSNDLNIGYNLTKGGEGVSGYHRTPEECLAISKRNSGIGNGMFGITASLESRKSRGKKVSETKKKNPTKSKIFAQKTIEKLKIAVKEKSSQKLSDEEKDKIIIMYNTGNFLKRDIAQQYNVELKTIEYIIRYWNEVKVNKNKRLTQEQKEKIIELYSDYTMKQVACIINLPINKVEAVIKTYQRKNNLLKDNKKIY